MSDEDKLAFMTKVKNMGMSKMAEFAKGMLSDEARRSKDGYFDMSAEDRDEYDSVHDIFREFFESEDFTGRGWDGDYESRNRRDRRGDSSDSDSDSDDINGVVGTIRDMLGNLNGPLGDIIGNIFDGSGRRDRGSDSDSGS